MRVRSFWTRLRVEFQPSRTLLAQMVGGATGPLLSFVILFALPLIGAFALTTSQFAMWTILSTVSTIALSIDFGGVALTMSRIHFEPRKPLLWRAGVLSGGGSILIGILAMLAWIPYSALQGEVAFALPMALLAIGTTAVAAAMRSYILILAQAALNDHLFGLRAFLTAGQSVLAAVVTIVVLFTSRSAWALPLGWFFSCAAVLAVGVPMCVSRGVYSRSPKPLDEVDGGSSAVFVSFAWSRSVVGILGAFIFQADRWVIGAIGGPAVLATYEVAWRFASLPRFLIQNLSAVLGGNAAASRVDSPESIDILLRRSARITGVIGAVGGLVTAGLYIVLTGQLGISRDLPLYIVMSMVFLLFGASAPLSVISLGVGMPKLDIPYMLATAMLSGASAAVAFVLDDPRLYMYANLVSLALGVASFFVYGPRMLRRRLRSLESRVTV